MNARISKIICVCLVVLLVSMSFFSCYGQFKLTKKLYKWNGQVGDKFVNTIVMWIFFILPVYEVVGFVDFAILNVIEFWTGENPITMGPDDKETQVVTVEDVDYEIIATKNRFDVIELNKAGENKLVSLIYDEKTKAWYVKEENSGAIKVAQMNQENLNILELIEPGGQLLTVDLESNKIISE